jgi:Protein of unknown function (DUF3089)
MSRARLLLLALVPAALLLAAVASSAQAKTTWLCKPGLKDDPCRPSLATTRFAPGGGLLGVDNVKAAKRPKFDCFYVYPTVSDQPGPQASLRIDPEERSIALFQAARYSRDCRVYAPMYRQITLAGLSAPDTVTPAIRNAAYADVRNAWREYLKKYNKGRGVVLVSHSQGSYVLRPLIAKEIDRKPALRKRLISALLLGGNVTVKQGKDTGGDFRNVRACRSASQIGCVVAFSTFGGPVPATARFGRTTAKGLEVLCTNPAALGGGAGRISPVYPSAPFAPGSTIGLGVSLLGQPMPQATTAWISFPKAYSARCSSDDGADVLQITPAGGAPKLNAVPDAGWGLHLTDANIALGELSDLVRRQAANWLKRR